MRVALVTAGVPHYRWPFYAALIERGVELHVFTAGRLPAGILAAASPDARVRLTHLDRGRRGWRGDVVSAVRAAAPDVILLEHGAALDFTWTVLLSPALPQPTILWTHGIARQELYGGRRGPASWGRWTQLRLADGIACYNRQMAERMAARFPQKVVGVAPNSTDGRPIVAARQALEVEGRQSVRARLGLRSPFYLVGLGRLVAEKEFDSLLRVVALMRRGGTDVGLILVGGGPEEEALRGEAEQLGLCVGNDVVFAGATASPSELAAWLFAADLCVSPGFLGLSAVDCLHAATPVASYLPSRDGPFHSPEWRYLTPGATGFFATEHAEGALAAACRSYLARPLEAREGTRRDCAAYALAHLGVDRMAEGMMDVIERAMRRTQAAH